MKFYKLTKPLLVGIIQCLPYDSHRFPIEHFKVILFFFIININMFTYLSYYGYRVKKHNLLSRLKNWRFLKIFENTMFVNICEVQIPRNTIL